MEYDSVVVHVTSRVESSSPSEVGALLLSHEGRIDSYSVNVDGTIPTANISTFTPAKGRPSFSSNSFSRGRGRGRSARGGRRGWSNTNNRPICQICGFLGHIAEKCYYRFDKDFIPQQRTSETQYSHPSRNRSTAPPTAAVAMANSKSLNDDWWFPDSGASHHVTNDLANLALGSEYTGGGSVLMGNGTGLPITHIGSSSFLPHTSNHMFLLNHLLRVPHISKNLLSVSKLLKTIVSILNFIPLFVL